MDPDLNRLAEAISRKSNTTRVFFRDDDGGWATDRLDALCQLMTHCAVALDIAVIPAAITSENVDAVRTVIGRGEGFLHLHQHGMSHRNHEVSGRKAEFGLVRSYEQQLCDIEKGRARLAEYFGDSVEPFFTPPWNRCTSATIAALSALRFGGLSRIAGSDPLDYQDLTAIDVGVDWLKSRRGQRLPWAAFCEYATGRFVQDDVVGVMLHHEHMDTEELGRLARFIEMLRAQPTVTFCSMQDLFRSATPPDVV